MEVALADVDVNLHPSIHIDANHDSLSVLTKRFRSAWTKGVEGILEAGLVLIDAKRQLEHGHFTDWVVDELRFGRRIGARTPDIRKAEMLMQLARNDVMSDPSHRHSLPPSPRTLWELTQIRPKQRLLHFIKDGTINAAMTREEAIALRRDVKKEREKPSLPPVEPEIGVLLDVCVSLGGGDSVRAHFRELKSVIVPSTAEFDRAIHWVKGRLAKCVGQQ